MHLILTQINMRRTGMSVPCIWQDSLLCCQLLDFPTHLVIGPTEFKETPLQLLHIFAHAVECQDNFQDLFPSAYVECQCVKESAHAFKGE